MLSYDDGTGLTDYKNVPMSMGVPEHQGRTFAGHLTFTFNGTMLTVPVAGVIGRNSRTFVLVEKENGYTSGEIISDSEIELTYLHDKTPYSAVIDTLKRV